MWRCHERCSFSVLLCVSTLSDKALSISFHSLLFGRLILGHQESTDEGIYEHSSGPDTPSSSTVASLQFWSIALKKYVFIYSILEIHSFPYFNSIYSIYVSYKPYIILLLDPLHLSYIPTTPLKHTEPCQCSNLMQFEKLWAQMVLAVL